MQTQIQTTNLPSEACQLRAMPTGKADVEESKFTLSPYKKGQRVKHPWWGEFMFETSSMRMGRKRIPVTVDHDTSRGAGYATSMSIGEDGLVNLDGDFVKNEHADYIKSFKGADVMETSLQFDPMETEFVILDEGEFKEVDGEEVEGPLVIFRNSPIVEVAFTLMGAVPNTQTSFSQQSSIAKESPMADKVPNEAEIQASARTQMQAQFARMNEMCGDKEFVASCFSKGMSIEDFSEKVIEKQNAEIAQFKAQVAQLEADLEAAKAEGQDGVQFSAAAAQGGEPEKLDYKGIVAKFCAEGMKSGEAHIKAAREFPEEYSAFRKSL